MIVKVSKKTSLPGPSSLPLTISESSLYFTANSSDSRSPSTRRTPRLPRTEVYNFAFWATRKYIFIRYICPRVLWNHKFPADGTEVGPAYRTGWNLSESRWRTYFLRSGNAAVQFFRSKIDIIILYDDAMTPHQSGEKAQAQVQERLLIYILHQPPQAPL